MFEGFFIDDAAARFRAAAAPPVAAVLLVFLYLSVYPLSGRVPASLFWAVAGVLLIGTILGATAIVRAIRRTPPRGILIGWLALAVLAELACAGLFLSFTVPWL